MTTTIPISGDAPRTRALVLGGGGPVGRAWQTGLATGFAEGTIDLSGADLIVGTSAGAIVGAEIALGHDMKNALPAPTAATAMTAPSPPSKTMQEILLAISRLSSSPNPEEDLRKIAQTALAADTPSEEAALNRSNLTGVTGQHWPSNLTVTSINTATGVRQIWDSTSGVELARALAASSALPGVWPPITVGENRYMDGGIYSALNADVAKGHQRVVVISCFNLAPTPESAPNSASSGRSLREVEMLRSGGSTVEIIAPDDSFLRLTNNGAMMLNPALETEAFRLGREQALSELTKVGALWAI